MATSKAKTGKAAPKKAAAKKTVKKTVAAKAKPKAVKAKVVQAEAKKPVLKLVTNSKVEAVKASPKKSFGKPAAKESFYARLLREKAERHEQYQQQQNENANHHVDQRMPSNHARFGRYAGPRRRAS